MTQLPADAKQRDFEQFGSEKRVFRDDAAERLNKPLPRLYYKICIKENKMNFSLVHFDK